MLSLVDSVKSHLTPSVVGRISASLNENDADLYKAATGYSTAILGGVASRSKDAAFIESVYGLLNSNDLSAALLQPTALLQTGDITNNAKSITEKVLASVFGNQVPELVKGIARYAGVKVQASATLLSVIGPMVMGVLHNKIASGKMDTGEFAEMMTTQKATLLGAIPSEIGVALGMAGLISPLHSFDDLQRPGKPAKWLLPLLLLLSLLMAFTIWKGCH